MTKSKKSIVMHGMLLCPLVLGHCAFLRANGCQPAPDGSGRVRVEKSKQ